MGGTAALRYGQLGLIIVEPMLLALRTKYALRAVLCLKGEKAGEYIEVQELSKRIAVSAPYLAKVVKGLAKAKILETRRGPNGGVRYPKKRKVSFFDICVAMKDPLLVSQCMMSKKKCDSNRHCQLHDHWARLRVKLVKMLKDAS